MPFDAFLKLEGIDGDSSKSGHEKEIEITAFSWGARNPSTMAAGKGITAGKVSVDSFSVTKWADSATAKLMLNCCNGKTIPSAAVTLRQAAGDSPIEYLKYTFTNVLVTSWTDGGSTGGEDWPTENVMLAFDTCKVEFTPQNDDGSKGATVAAGWNVKTQTAL